MSTINQGNGADDRAVPIDPGTAAVLDRATEAYRAELIDSEAKPGTLPLGGSETAPFAFSYAGAYEVCVRHPDTETGYDGTLVIASTAEGAAFDATLEFSLLNGGDVFEMAGRALLDGNALEVTLARGEGECLESFRTVVSDGGPPWDWTPIGDIVFQQQPDDVWFNGDIQLTPAPEQSDKTTFTIIKLPRRDSQGRFVYEGTGPNRKLVRDCYFWRGGKWWRIKDPTLKVKGNRELIDLRDGSGNPNYEPAGTDPSDRLNRIIFPTGWDKFWKGFKDSTARQLQGLAVTLQAATGVDLRVWLKIKRLRDQGKSWLEIFSECWLEILLVIGLAVLLAGGLGRLLGKIFGPLVRRYRRRLLGRPPRPPAGGPPRPPTSPTNPTQRASLRQILRDYLARLRAQLRELNRRLRDLNSPTSPYRHSRRERARLRREISRQIGETRAEIAAVTERLGRLGP